MEGSYSGYDEALPLRTRSLASVGLRVSGSYDIGEVPCYL